MFAAQTHGAAFVTAKLTTETVPAGIFFILTFTHFYYEKITKS